MTIRANHFTLQNFCLHSINMSPFTQIADHTNFFTTFKMIKVHNIIRKSIMTVSACCFFFNLINVATKLFAVTSISLKIVTLISKVVPSTSRPLVCYIFVCHLYILVGKNSLGQKELKTV